MAIYLGIIPDKNSAEKIRKLLAHVGTLFDGYQVEVKLVKPEKFYLPLFYLGENLNPVKRFFIARKIDSMAINKLSLGAGIIKPGLSKKFKEHVALTFVDGADELRNIILELSQRIGVPRERIFIPHITLGRVVNELSIEEYANISSAFKTLNSTLEAKLSEISWIVEQFYIFEVLEEDLKVQNIITLKDRN